MYRTKKLLNLVFDSKINSVSFSRWKNVRAFELKYSKLNGILIGTNLDSGLKKTNNRLNSFKANLKEHSNFVDTRFFNNRKLLVFIDF